MNAHNFGRTVVALSITALMLAHAPAQAASVKRFLEERNWQCSFTATINEEREEQTGPGGMANDGMRGMFQALSASGMTMDQPGGNTDSYREEKEQTVEGRIRLHYIYNGGPDGIQIAGWDNGSADVKVRSYFEGSEQNKSIFRDRSASYEGPTTFYGDEYSPGFDLWLFPEQGTYTIAYSLAPVEAQQVEHCRMAEDMEGGRRKAESATDADMPLGGMLSAFTKAGCATETVSRVNLEGGVLSAAVEDNPIPSSGLELSGEGPSIYAEGSMIRWSCKPE